MTHRLIICLLVLLIPLTVLADRGLQVRENLERRSGRSIGAYRALIIGINDYLDPQIPDLETAVNDARGVAELLKESYGFTTVELLLDSQADGSSILTELRRMAVRSQENDSVLIYFAGHGDLDKITGDGWWIPYNAKARDPFTYIDNSVIQKTVKAIAARHVLLVADSCFSGTLFGEARSLPPVIDDRYYGSLFKEKSRWGMTSGNLTPVTDRGTGGHSLFAYQFIKSLKENRKPYLTPREIYQRIAPIISNNSEQMPITKPIRNADDQGGEFIFIRNQPETTASGGTGRTGAGMQVAGGTIQSQTAGRGRIRINSQPSAAEIYIDSIFSGTSPLDIPIKPGIYAVEARKSGYKSESKRIRVFEGQDLKLTLILDQKGSSLYITSAPSGADVHIDSAYSGQTPLSLKGLAPGLRMTVKISKQNYQDWQQMVTIGSADRSLQATLSRKQTAPADMVLIEAGEFMMGSEDGDSDEKPVHRVYLDAYYIDKHEVTVADYRKCVTAGSCREFTTQYWSNKDQGRSSYCNWTATGRDQHPINCVDWSNAKAYCEYASKRLPTEAEWEKAATWKNGRKFKYPSGKNSVSCADAVMDDGGDGCGKDRTWEVGSKPEEINGTYDMAGNVWEWVEDWYRSYPSGNQRNPTGPSTGSNRVLRGGGWSGSASHLRGAIRGNFDPSCRDGNLGFRCARSPK